MGILVGVDVFFLNDNRDVIVSSMTMFMVLNVFLKTQLDFDDGFYGIGTS